MGKGKWKRKGKGPTRANSRCQSRPADLPSVVYVKNRYGIARVAAQRCSGDGLSGALAVAHSLWCCLWLHMLAVAANSWMKEPVLWVLAAARASPATSAIHTTNGKMSNKCSLFSLETQLSRSALPSGLTLLCRRGFPLCLLRCSACSELLHCAASFRSAAPPTLRFRRVFPIIRLFHVVDSVLGGIPVVACIGETV